MAREVLNNLDSMGIQRGKINANFLEVYTIKLEADQVLTRTNNTPYTPVNPYHPATKSYADSVATSWASIYDPTGVNSDAFDRGNHHGLMPGQYLEQSADYRFASDPEKTYWNQKEDEIGAKGTAFNRNFGTGAGFVAEGNHTHAGQYEPANSNIQGHISTVTGNPHQVAADEIPGVQEHIDDTANPHQVTKTQVGLDQVDNTSDLNKPVSTATQAALDTKTEVEEPYRDYAPGPAPDYKEGRVFYDTDGALSVYTDEPDMTLNLGQESVIKIMNNSGGPIGNGQAVHHTGVLGGLPSVDLAQATTVVQAYTLGVATHDIPNGEAGYITTEGRLGGNFSAFNAGDVLYLSETVPGGYQTAPPDIVTIVGSVLDNSTSGAILVSIASLVALPTFLGSMAGAAVPTTLTGGTTYAIAGYNAGSNLSIGLDVDATAGTIHVPTTGVYRFTVNLVLTHNTANAERVLNFEVYNAIDGIVVTVPTSSGRDQGASSVSLSFLFSATENRDYQLRLAPVDTYTTVSADFLTFDIQSVHLIAAE